MAFQPRELWLIGSFVWAAHRWLCPGVWEPPVAQKTVVIFRGWDSVSKHQLNSTPVPPRTAYAINTGCSGQFKRGRGALHRVNIAVLHLSVHCSTRLQHAARRALRWRG